jgi:hypothetical protein
MHHSPKRPWLLLRSLLQSRVFVCSVAGIALLSAAATYNRHRQTNR